MPPPRVRSEGNALEMRVRSRFDGVVEYGTNVRSLPGSPDIVVWDWNMVVLVHGCFWHGHDCPRGRVIPRRHPFFWQEKVGHTRERDRFVVDKLHALGFCVHVVWECEEPAFSIQSLLQGSAAAQ